MRKIYLKFYLCNNFQLIQFQEHFFLIENNLIFEANARTLFQLIFNDFNCSFSLLIAMF